MTSLLQRAHRLSEAAQQRQCLERLPFGQDFAAILAATGQPALQANGVETLQMNVGKLCNQTCRHCHVDAGPDRREVMPPEVVDACLRLLDTAAIQTLDITGGAPELHAQFRDIVRRARALGRRVLDRCNLTVLLLPKHADLPDFLAAERVEIVASLPSMNPRQTDAQRGSGVHEGSLVGLRRLNAVGYGRDPELRLNLVTNPVGAFLPANQASLEAEWKRWLKQHHDIDFDNLYTITNMPISRYLDYLLTSGNFEAYMDRLVQAFNPQAVSGLMCRKMLSVGWDGTLYDCDFNQMLELPIESAEAPTIFAIDAGAAQHRRIVVGNHCFGCTAGAGSSCGGATVR